MIDIINDNFNDLAKDYYKLQEEYEQLQQENQKLNNVISELEEYLEKTIIDGGTRGSMTFWYKEIYEYLKELKGDKNE